MLSNDLRAAPRCTGVVVYHVAVARVVWHEARVLSGPGLSPRLSPHARATYFHPM